MDSSTYGLIMGGVIALVSSVLTSIVNFMFQNLDSNKKRKWELEDIKREKSQRIVLDRIDRIELWATEAMKWVSMQPQQIEKILDNDTPSLTALVEGFRPLLDTIYLNAFSPEILNDNKLTESTKIFDESFTQVFLETQKIAVAYRNHGLDRTSAVSKIIGLCSDCGESYGSLIKCIDELRIKTVSK